METGNLGVWGRFVAPNTQISGILEKIWPEIKWITQKLGDPFYYWRVN
jgi:hypothetical protein